MKKFVYALAVILPLGMLLNGSDAQAQRRNTTDKDVRAAIPAYDPAAGQVNVPDAVSDTMDEVNHKVKRAYNEYVNDDQDYDGQDRNYHARNRDYNAQGRYDCGCKKDHDCLKNCRKHQKKIYADKLNEEINEDYNEAITKIHKSGFNQEQKELLMKQARENRDLALEQAEDRADLRREHRDERMEMNMQNMMEIKANRKAVKEVDSIN